jgi:hypothetical protein
MNLNPETTDRIKVEVSSDSDVAGIIVNAIETDDDSGLFGAVISFTQSSASSGNRLFAIPDDTIYAKYEDNTLPAPHSIQDDLDIQTKSKLESDTPSLQRVSVKDIFFADSFGNPLEPTINETTQIVGSISNNQKYNQSFVYIIQVKDQEQSVVSLSWIQGELASNQNLELSQSWTPTEIGNYDFEVFVWKSLNDSTPLSQSLSVSFSLNGD